MSAGPDDESRGSPGSDPEAPALRRRHLRFGWWQVLVFMTLGLGLEALHGLKAGFYLDVGNETRRFLWTLAHAHGVLLGLVHVAFALSAGALPASSARLRRWASPCLMAGSLLLPGGFFAGGVVFYGGDPGPAVLVVPVGAALVLAAVGLTAWSSHGGSAGDD